MTNLEAAVEVTKAAIPLNSGTWMRNPEQVAKFIEVIHAKLVELDGQKK
jgi:hypothetical protein